MRAVVQRVHRSRVTVDGEVVGEIGAGLLVLLGIVRGDRPADADYLAEKITHLRVFEDAAGRMNHSLRETGGRMLIVSQFTLAGDCRKGRRPSFDKAAPPEEAEPLYRHFVAAVRSRGVSTATGRFQAMMTVALENDGPVTLVLDSPAS